MLGIGLFAAVELSSRPVNVRRLAAVLGPSLLVLAAFSPALIASAHAQDPETALRLLVKFHAPGHYDPARFRRWVAPLVGALVVAWGALPILRTAGHEAAARLWRFAAVATALCVAATVIVSIPPWLGFTRLFVWRIAPFAQLASQLIVIAAALAPTETSETSATPMSRRRVYAVLIGAAVLLVESVHLGGGHYLYTSVLGLVAAVGLAAKWLRRPTLAIIVAVAACGLALAHQRDALVDPPLFAPGSEDDVFRWVRTETPVDAMFLVPPYMVAFRLRGERAIVVDTKSPPLVPDELVAWYRRLCAIMGTPDVATHEAMEAAWDALTPDQLLAAARWFHADYIVLDKLRSSARLTAPVAFESYVRVIYRVR
jgi:hypothetical protein